MHNQFKKHWGGYLDYRRRCLDSDSFHSVEMMKNEVDMKLKAAADEAKKKADAEAKKKAEAEAKA